jgi:hypothetical protein
MNKFLRYTLITILICGVIGVFYTMGYCITGEIVRNPNVIVKQNSEYLWVKKYTMYNEDSCIYKYHQPIIYEGVVTYRSSHFQGIPGKGGHIVYKTYIKYNGNEEYREFGYQYYNKHKEGDKVNVKVTFYPWYQVDLLN